MKKICKITLAETIDTDNVINMEIDRVKNFV